MSWQVFFTAFALLACAVSIYFAWRSGESAANASHSEHRLAIMRGQVSGLCTSIEALDDKHRRLAGRVYADQYWNGQREEQPSLRPLAPSADDGFTIAGECANWTIAQKEGPSSTAAKCECSYCNARRADRAARRAKLRASK